MLATRVKWVACVLFIPLAALADAKEVYLQLSGAPSLLAIDDPVDGRMRVLHLGGEAGLAAFVGMTHELHLGASLRVGGGKDVRFMNQVVQLSDGSRPTGDLYEDTLLTGLSALIHWRFDTGDDFAPTARVEVGGAFHSYMNLAHYPTGTSLQLALSSLRELVLTARATVGVEYRFWNRYVASAGLAFRYNINALTVWQAEVPITVGLIW